MKDKRYEQQLDFLNMNWTYIEVFDVRTISGTRDAIKQIRLDGIDQDYVDRYARAMERGDEFPAVVVGKMDSGKIVYMNGLHRDAALKKIGRHTIDAYVVAGASGEDIEAARRNINIVEGRGFTRDQVMEHCLQLVEKRGYKVGAVAQAFLVSESAIHIKLRVKAMKKMLYSVGVNTAQTNLSDTQIDKLHSTPNIYLQALAQLVHECKVPATDITRINHQLKKASKEADGHKIIERWRKRFPGETGPIPKPKRRTITALIKRSERLLVDAEGLEMSPLDRMTALERQEHANRLRDVIATLTILLHKIEGKKRARA